MTATTDERERLEDIVWEIARQDFRAFKRFCWIQYRDEITRETGIKQMDPTWTHLAEFDDALIAGRNIIVLKCRQRGFSWDIAAFVLWKAMYHAALPLIEFSMGEKEAAKLLRKSNFIFERLPSALQVPLVKPKTDGQMLWPNDVDLVALPSTENAGRSLTSEIVVFDEFGFHEYAESGYSAAEPMANQIVIISTANGDNFFGKTWWSAYDGDDPDDLDLLPIFIPWNAGPGRTEEWYASKKRRWKGTEQNFSRENPATPQEAFSAGSRLVYSAFRRADHVLAYHPFRWEDAKYRVAGVDWGSGYRDPTAIVVLGRSGPGHVHQFGEFYLHEDVTMDQIALWLLTWHQRAPLASVECDPSGVQSIVDLDAQLRSGGLPARRGVNSLQHIHLLQGLLEHDQFSIYENCVESILEFDRYSNRFRKDPNTKESYDGGKPVPHDNHAMDARRYAMVRMERDRLGGGPVILDVNRRRAVKAV